MSKATFIRTNSDSLTVRELADQLDCSVWYVRRVLGIRVRKVRSEYAPNEAVVMRQRERAMARSRRRAADV